MRICGLAIAWIAAALLVLPLNPSPAAAAIVIDFHKSVVVKIRKSAQRMSVAVDGEVRYTWRISTGRRGFGTPNGTYRPKLMARHWFSRKYYNSPMPYSIFFYRGYAIHGTYYLSQLGGPASHGCVRLHPKNAAVLFALVRSEGKGVTTIVVTN
jgi:lipoprotein-anchoring transpeptidase ErfK/SrfK